MWFLYRWGADTSSTPPPLYGFRSFYLRWAAGGLAPPNEAPPVEPPVVVTEGHHGRHGVTHGTAGDHLWWREQQLRKLIAKLKEARDGENRKAATASALRISEDVDDGLHEAIAAIAEAQNIRKQLVAVLAMAQRMLDQIREQDEEEELLLLS